MHTTSSQLFHLRRQRLASKAVHGALCKLQKGQLTRIHCEHSVSTMWCDRGDKAVCHANRRGEEVCRLTCNDHASYGPPSSDEAAVSSANVVVGVAHCVLAIQP